MTTINKKKQQFNIHLPPSLIRAIEHAAIERSVSLSSLVETALRRLWKKDLLFREISVHHLRSRSLPRRYVRFRYSARLLLATRLSGSIGESGAQVG
jgi:hypothetical protein